MTVHIVKLCVGVDAIEDLVRFQTARRETHRRAGLPERTFHQTRMVPKRQADVLDGGSLYWVIRGVIQVRQAVIGFEDGLKDDGTKCCRILLDPELVPVRPTPRRAFQGWRYLDEADAPEDLGAGLGADLGKMPPKMRRELAELGLI